MITQTQIAIFLVIGLIGAALFVAGIFIHDDTRAEIVGDIGAVILAADIAGLLLFIFIKAMIGA